MAMHAEFEVAVDDGTSLSFAAGCLTGAVCDMPRREEGRFTLISYTVALGLFPIAALLILGAAAGFPFLPSGHAGISGWVAGDGAPASLLAPAYRGFAPALALLTWTLVVGHLLMPWFMLERDWDRVGLLARINGAATITLFLFTAALFLDTAFMLLPAVALTIELSGAWFLHRWQTHLFAGAPPGIAVT